MVTAFSTSSSAATLPTSIQVAEAELQASPSVTRFVLPLGATMNMNGTALFEGVTVLFLAQVSGLELTLTQQLIVIALSVITAVGAAGVPGGSIPLLPMVLLTVNIQPDLIFVILGVDRLLDMCRTTVNVVGDLTAVMYIDRTDGSGQQSVEAHESSSMNPQPIDEARNQTQTAGSIRDASSSPQQPSELPP
jgi:DAACS family dicarboxylate/amino acid:cation (Na+ or H+) symporter